MKDKYLSVNNNDEFRKHFDKWNFFDCEKSLENTGQIFLFEHFVTNGSNNHQVYYPKLAVFLVWPMFCWFS